MEADLLSCRRTEYLAQASQAFPEMCLDRLRWCSTAWPEIVLSCNAPFPRRSAESRVQERHVSSQPGPDMSTRVLQRNLTELKWIELKTGISQPYKCCLAVISFNIQATRYRNFSKRHLQQQSVGHMVLEGKRKSIYKSCTTVAMLSCLRIKCIHCNLSAATLVSSTQWEDCP